MSRRASYGDKFISNIIVGILWCIFVLPFYMLYYLVLAIIWIVQQIINATFPKTKGKNANINSYHVKEHQNNSYKSSEYYNVDFLNPSNNDMELFFKIDKMTGQEFERFVAEILRKSDFENVYTTKTSGDYGADVIGELNGIRYAFQCKRSASEIGPRPIGEVLRGMNYYKCQKGVIITNNYFTSQARMESEVNNIELWDRKKLLVLCRNVEKKKKV